MYIEISFSSTIKTLLPCLLKISIFNVQLLQTLKTKISLRKVISLYRPSPNETKLQKECNPPGHRIHTDFLWQFKDLKASWFEYKIKISVNQITLLNFQSPYHNIKFFIIGSPLQASFIQVLNEKVVGCFS
jgi:hypothetical protein